MAPTCVFPTVSHAVSGSDGSPGQQTSATAASPLCVCVCLQDEKLKVLVQKLGTADWKCIASYIPVSLLVSFLCLFLLFSVQIHSFVSVSLCRLTPSISVSTAGTRSWIQNWSKVRGPKRRMRRLVTGVDAVLLNLPPLCDVLRGRCCTFCPLDVFLYLSYFLNPQGESFFSHFFPTKAFFYSVMF